MREPDRAADIIRRPERFKTADVRMRAMADRSENSASSATVHSRGPELDFDSIVKQNSARIYNVLHRLTGNAQDAEELTQEVFYNACKSLPRFRGDSDISTWLYRIAMNVAADAVRKKMRRPRVEQSMDYEEREAAGGVARGGSAEAQFMARESMERIRRAILKLPLPYRAPFVLNVVEGYSHEEISKIMGISNGVARMRLYRAMKMLRKELSPENGGGWES